jgi:hypothetical protein
MRLLTLFSLIVFAAQAAAADPVVMNTTCPVSGKAVDPSVKTRPYNHKTDQAAKASPGGAYLVAFCCAKCEPTYAKDPEKYREGLEKQAPHSKKND